MIKAINITSLCILLLISGCGGGKKKSDTINIEDLSAKDPSFIFSTAKLNGTEDCDFGGVQIISGPDLNGDQKLDENEVINTKLVCNGVTGYNTLIRIYDYPANSEHCATGGKKIVTGRDLNANTTLEETEIDDTQYICNGLPGSDGNSVNNQLIRIFDEAVGANCITGGKGIKTGIDINGNNILDDEEINPSDTQYLCNGQDGVNTRSVETISCAGPLENRADYIWNYKLTRFNSDDVLVTASIISPAATYGSLAYYAAGELTNTTPAVRFVFDVEGVDNYGLWTIYLDSTEGRTYVIYADQDLPSNPQAWSMTTDKCTTKYF